MVEFLDTCGDGLQLHLRIRITSNQEQLMIGAARALADSLVQVILSLVVATMFWTNGDGLVSVLHDALRRLGGPIAERALDVAAGRYAASLTALSVPQLSRP